ncbi:medium-chain acyl-CoA ligase ACSF2, mitochondrial-like isoform X2 [Anneissia japonica]|uniref:medium-chain acyl-CoA ligase ACSF2, mitochondrial-like isoform X1 n=1 Tax=Anneissia japonica TaxID=1529436 RepID=UPI001425B984|nr:medium-chain acyl-CoA ligase ACSF2, mitochondrial-like isoform X1 [Anneissia japonica]XP_033100566.1 medium-chain acyl-CoA ligase ACSF2, mitochondrial-like isoform X2 [Anneissia japonica]
MEVSLNISYASSNQSSPLIGLTLHQLLEKRVNEHPDREMYVFPEDGDRITFNLYKDRVERLATGLLSIGMKKGDRLAIWSNIHMEFLLFVGAARSIGVITVRIRPTFPNIGVKDILLLTGCKMIVLGRSPTNLYDRLTDIRTASAEDASQTPHFDAIIGVGENNKSGTYNVNDIEKLGSDIKFIELFKLIRNQVTFDDDSDIFSTSGSTGKPKHVVHTHFSMINGTRPIFNYLASMPDKDRGNRRVFARNSTHISGEASGVMPPLVASMTSVFAPSVYDIRRIVETIQDERCTETILLITGLYDLCSFKDIGEYDLSSLKVCVVGGSNIPPELAEDYENKFGSKIFILYGSTEMMFPAGSFLDLMDKRRSGIRMLPNAEIQLVDDKGKCVPVGSVGEVWSRSSSNFQRYLKNEEQTNAVKSHGWFKTGDLGVFDATGALAIVGRKKDVIARGGAKILPADIENVLSIHPSIDQVQVIGVPDDRLGEDICICVRTKKNASIDKDQIVTYLTGKVRVEESIPGYVLLFELFPKNDIGKIDRASLKEQALQQIKHCII